MDTKNNTGNQFYLNIRYHDNQSWQGSLQRLDTGETINFRSELELLHLVEEVARRDESSEHENQKLREWNVLEEEDRQIYDNMMKTGTTGL